MKRRLGFTALTGALAALPFLLGAPDLAQAQTAPGSGSFPNSFLIPGTNTSLRVGGFVKMDAWYDFSVHGDTGNNGGTTGINVGGIPLDNNVPGIVGQAANLQQHSFHGRMAWSAAESRFNFESRTPTAWGEVKDLPRIRLRAAERRRQHRRPSRQQRQLSATSPPSLRHLRTLALRPDLPAL